MLADVRHADLRQIIDRGSESDDTADIRRARFEFPGELIPVGVIAPDFEDNISPALIMVHRVQNLRLSIENADARRSEHFMRGKNEKVAAQIRNPGFQMRNGLRSVDQDFGAHRVGFAWQSL